MAARKEEQVQRGHYYAIVDEVDSILIDEARTPLIISGPAVVTFDEQYAQFKPQVEVDLPRAGTALQPLPSRSRGTDQASCTRRMARNAQDGRGARAGDRACCFTASRWASPSPTGLMKLLEEPGESAADEPGGAAAPRRPEEGRALRGEGGALLRHGREEPRGGPDRKRAATYLSPEGSGRVHAAGPDDGAARDRHRAGNRPAQTPGGQDQAAAGVRGQGPAHPRHFPVAEGLLPLRKGRAIRRPGQQGHHRRRKHRPPDDRPPLERRPAPGRRGQGRRRDRARDPDPGHHHHPELLPPVPEAGRHDRHGGNRSLRVLRHLQAGRAGHPHQPAGGAQGRQRFRLQDPAREIQRGPQGNQGRSTARAGRSWSARSPSKSASISRACSSARASSTPS